MSVSVDTLSALLDQKFATQNETLDEKFETHLGPIRKDVQEVKDSVQAHDARISKLEEALSSGQPQKFVPTFIEIKNFCPYSERRTSGIDRPRAEALLEKLKVGLPPTLLDKIGELEIFGPKGHKVRVYVKPPGAVEVAFVFKDKLASDPDLKFNENVLFTTAERTPEDTKRFAKCGKAKAFLMSKMRAGGLLGEARCSWSPDFTLSVKGQQGEAVVGSVSEDASIKWELKGLQAAFGGTVTIAAVEAEFAGFRD